ncbi:MAG: UTP--glucose-1-phosphate uridylyltransferase [Pseudomonadota bacterium]
MIPTPIRKAVFPVAGLGTRFLPATKAVPKEMLTLVDRPLIQYAVDEARAAGIEQFIFVTANGKSALEAHFDAAPVLEQSLAAKGKSDLLEALEETRLPAGSVAFVRQPEALGLGHAVWCARHLIGNEPFAVILPDDVIASRQPCLAQMIGARACGCGNMVAAMEVATEAISSYGCLDVVGRNGRIVQARGVVEKPAPEAAPSRLAVVGRYLLEPTVLQHLDRVGPGAGGEIQLTDALAADIETSGLSGLVFEGERFDCGSKQGFLEATVAFALSRPDLAPNLRQAFSARLARNAIAA